MLSTSDTRALLLSGQPGVGKSALAYEVARSLRDIEPAKSQLYIDVRGVPPANIATRVQRHVTAVLGKSTPDSHTTQELGSAYNSVVAQEGPLILVDNVDPLARSNELSPLIAPHVILTCAADPFLSTQKIVVNPLPPRLAANIARGMLPESMGQLGLRIGILSEGIPLKAVILSELAYLNQDRTGQELASMLSSIDWSQDSSLAIGAVLDALPTNLRETLEGLCIFASGFRADAAAAVLDRDDVGEVLSSLRSRGLLNWSQQDGIYRLPSLIRGYLLSASPDRAEPSLAHAMHYSKRLREAAAAVAHNSKSNPTLSPGDAVAPLALLRSEWDEIIAAIEWMSRASKAGNQTASLLLSVTGPLVNLAHKLLVAASTSEEGALSPGWLRDRAQAYARNGTYDRAVAAYVVSTKLYVDEGDLWTPLTLGGDLLPYIGEMDDSQAAQLLDTFGRLVMATGIAYLANELDNLPMSSELGVAEPVHDKIMDIGVNLLIEAHRQYVLAEDRSSAADSAAAIEGLLDVAHQLIDDARTAR